MNIRHWNITIEEMFSVLTRLYYTNVFETTHRFHYYEWFIIMYVNINFYIISICWIVWWQVVGTLLHVFVSIEMTGQGVAFEQKFNYRRPMYAVMKFLWTLKSHRQQFRVLAIEAETNIDAAQPPLFLQFVNLLINDAIYLLDEALSYMAQLRELQHHRLFQYILWGSFDLIWLVQ